MKKSIIIIISLIIYLPIFSQGTISFYTANGVKKVSTIKCGEFDNLKIKFTVPSYVKNYDKVELILYRSVNDQSRGIIRWVGKGDVASMASNPKMEKWLLRPGKQDGDFFYGRTAVNDWDLCGLPRKRGMKNMKVQVKMIAYTKTGTKKYWDDWDKAYKYKPIYTSGKTVASGSLTIVQLPAMTGYQSKNGVVSIEKVVDNLEDEQLIGTNEGDRESSFLNKLNGATSSNFELFKAVQTQKSGKGFAVFNVLFITDDQVKNQVQQLLGQIPSDLDTYGELKRDLLQLFVYSTNPHRFSKTFFEWPEIISAMFCPFIDPGEIKKQTGNFFSNMSYWSKKKVGDYEFDYLKVPDAYGQGDSYKFDKRTLKFTSNDVVPADIEVYAIKRGKYNVFIFATYDDYNYNNVFAKSKDPSKAKGQTEFIEKTFATLKFLK